MAGRDPKSVHEPFRYLSLTEAEVRKAPKCSDCGKKLSPTSPQQEIECRIINNIKYDVYNCGEYYQRSVHGEAWCRMCFYKSGLGDVEELKRTQTKLWLFLLKRVEKGKQGRPSQQQKTTWQEQLDEMEKLDVILGDRDLKESQVKEELSLLMKSSLITQNGGTVIIDGVELQFQPNSFKDGTSHTIQVTILPQKLYSGPAKDCNAFLTVMVDIQPNNVTLEKPAKLKLPHCFQFKDAAKCRAQIFHSHHDEGEKPNWKDITESVSAVVTDSACEIELRSFCWIVALIFGRAESTRIRLYALAEPYNENSDFVTVIVGYHPAIPGGDEIYRQNRVNNLLGDYQSMDFFLRPRWDLHIAFIESYPNGWSLRANMTRNRVIPYEDIERLNERHFPLTFCRDDHIPGLPELTLKVHQQGYLPFFGKHPYFLHIRIQCKTLQQRTEGTLVVRDTVLQDLSNNITGEWKSIGRYLEVPDSALSDIESRYTSFRELSIQMLILWKRREGRHAKINNLQQALRASDRSDLADSLDNGDNEEPFHKKTKKMEKC